jgi:sirohydrochlorin cobaltochelatase
VLSFLRPWLAGKSPRPRGRPGGGLRADRGILVVGHGTADPVGAAETRQVAHLVAGLMPGVPVELGFLEVIGPTIADAVTALAARGCSEVVVAPLLLFAAGHARRDVPEAVRDAAVAAGVSAVQADPLGCHEAIVRLADARRREAIAGLPPVPDADSALVVIGRGSSDPTAREQLDAFVRATRPRPSRVELGFVAAARPTLDEAFATAARGARVRRVIVQPHLLFRGHVEEQVSAALARARQAHPAVEWVQVARLGADPLVAQAVVDRAAAAAVGG